MTSLDLQIDTKQVENALKNSDTSIKKAARKIGGAIDREIIRKAKKNYKSNWGKNTGNLLKNFKYKGFPDFNSMVYIRGTDTGKKGAPDPQNSWYAVILERGRKENYRTDNKDKPLVFKIGEKWITAQPKAITAKPFLKPAIQSTFSSGKATTIVDEQIQKILTKEFEKASK